MFWAKNSHGINPTFPQTHAHTDVNIHFLYAQTSLNQCECTYPVEQMLVIDSDMPEPFLIDGKPAAVQTTCVLWADVLPSLLR